jgi:hypothetical protein
MSVLPSGAASCPQLARSGNRFPLLISATAVPRRAVVVAPVGATGATSEHALASAATPTSNDRPNHRDALSIISILLVCGASRI